MFQKKGHGFLAFLDGLKAGEGQQHPFFEQARTHGAYRMIEYVEQRGAGFVVGRDQFQVSDREPVEPDVVIGLQATEAADMAQAVVFGGG